jgi:hypothetical protein
MHLCVDAYVIVYSSCTWFGARGCSHAMPSSFSDLSKNALYWKATSKRLNQVKNHQGIELEVSR